MFSNIVIFVSTIFLLIAYMDKYSGSPTASFLLMGIIIMFQIIIMYVTGTVWFRKMLINMGVLLVYFAIAHISVRDCVGYDEYLNHPDEDPAKGEGMQIGSENLYPAIQILPDYDSFKYHMSCTHKTESFDFLKQVSEERVRQRASRNFSSSTNSPPLPLPSPLSLSPRPRLPSRPLPGPSLRTQATSASLICASSSARSGSS